MDTLGTTETEANENQVDDSTSLFRVGGSKDYHLI